MLKRIYQKKYFKILLAIFYSYLFYYGYQDFLYGAYEYMGFEIGQNRLQDTSFILYTFSVAVVPVCFHSGIRRISSFLCIFIYLILYVPIIFTFFFKSDLNTSYVMYLQSLFLVGMCMLIYMDRIPVVRSFYLPASLDPMKIILVLTWLGTLYIGIKYRGSLKFSSYEDVYIQRAASVALGTDIFTAYFGAFLANVFIPISSAYGLFSKKKLYFISGLSGSLVFYMATADKAILLFPFIILVLYYFLRNKSLNNSFSAITLGFIGIMTVTLITGLSIFSALFWMRTIGNGGLLTSLYYDFFSDHPITYFSHINFVNAISQGYPYGNRSLGQVIAKHFFGADDANMNANFWATDGIASLGNIGILVSSFFLCIIFFLFNKATYGYNKLFLICIFIPYISSLLNQSLFSSLLTGGALLIMLILSFKSMVKNPYINENINNSGGTPSVR